MLGHIGINVQNLDAARRYYSAIMPLVGLEMYLDAHDEFAYRPASGKSRTFCSSIHPSRRRRIRDTRPACNTWRS
jgi:catechol 2,3-dioxygenase-like lactoylglutathione lyase family enzyme